MCRMYGTRYGLSLYDSGRLSYSCRRGIRVGVGEMRVRRSSDHSLGHPVLGGCGANYLSSRVVGGKAG